MNSLITMNSGVELRKNHPTLDFIEPKKLGLEPSIFLQMAEEKGFEPLQGLHLLPVFETSPFSRLGIPPMRDKL